MSKIPKRFTQFVERYPAVGSAYQALSEATLEAGPLENKTRALVKLGIALGARMEGAVHSHTRKCLEAGANADEIRHSAILAATTLGFPTMMTGLTWVEDVLSGD